MKKKLISVLLSTALVASMTGCGQSGQGTSTTQTTNTEGAESVQTEQTTQETEQSEGAEDESLYATDAVLKLWGSQDDQNYLQEAIGMFKEDHPEAAGWTIALLLF